MQRHRTPLARPGLTIIELMFVIIIIGIIGGVVTYNLVGAADSAKIATTKTSMQTIKAALDAYRAEYSSYPPTGLGLGILVQLNKFQTLPQDSWNRPFEYFSPTLESPSGFLLVSYGADTQPNTTDDIKFTDGTP